jgi:hypothetical protein
MIMSDTLSRKSKKTLMCPSADAEMSGSVIFGIVAGTPEEPHVVHLDRVKAIPQELLTLEAPVKPSEIFRIAATCIENGCMHFDGTNCRLTERIIDGLPAVSEQLPACAIRSKCRWWHQEGKEACFRCQQVVRDNYNATEHLFNTVDPSIYSQV